MYRVKEEQKEMLTVCKKFVKEIFAEYRKKELNDLDFVSKCNFVCGFSYATFGDGERYEYMKTSIKLLINTYQSAGGGDNEKE